MKFIIINRNYYTPSLGARFIHYGKNNLFSSIRNSRNKWDINSPPLAAVVKLKVKREI